MKLTWHQCPKCKHFSGDDWKQCGGKCPVVGSPHFDVDTFKRLGDLVQTEKGPE